jgi:hypothetical protein
MKPYLDSEDKTIRLLCLATLADLVHESESEILKSNGAVIKFLLWSYLVPITTKGTVAVVYVPNHCFYAEYENKKCSYKNMVTYLRIRTNDRYIYLLLASSFNDQPSDDFSSAFIAMEIVHKRNLMTAPLEKEMLIDLREILF